MADQSLLTAAGRIADGEHIDWASITSTLPSEEDRAIADELALVAQIAAGHRQLHQLLPVAADTPPNLVPDRARWGHLDRIPESALDWEAPVRNATRLAATLVQHRAEAVLFRRLATLNADARIEDVTASLDELEWRGVPRSAFVALCDELGFDTVRERVHRWAN